MSNTAQIFNIGEHRPVVKADLENGYDRLAHTLTDALAKNPAKLSGCEFQLVLAIITKTYRYHKKVDWISNSQLIEITGMGKTHLSKTLKSLLIKNIIVRSGKKIGLNNVVSEWGVTQSDNLVTQSGNFQSEKKLPNQVTGVTQSGNRITQSGNKSYPITPPQKKTTITKEINTKEKSNAREQSTLMLPDFLNPDSIHSFIDQRKKIKKPMTDEAIKRFIRKLVKCHHEGYNIDGLIDDAIISGWQTVYPKPEHKHQQQSENGLGPIGNATLNRLNNMVLE